MTMVAEVVEQPTRICESSPYAKQRSPNPQSLNETRVIAELTVLYYLQNQWKSVQSRTATCSVCPIVMTGAAATVMHKVSVHNSNVNMLWAAFGRLCTGALTELSQ
jgi:hypothetical protein